MKTAGWTNLIVTHPWTGQSYHAPKIFPHRTMILGESNYTEVGKFRPSLVRDCVLNDMATHGNRDTAGFCKFSTKLRRIIFGTTTQITPTEFWEDVVFYNFIQARVGEHARDRPTKVMWEKSIDAFVEIIHHTQPERVLVLGKANWENLKTHLNMKINGEFTATLEIDDQRITSGYINHPSSSLSYKEWHPIAQSLILNNPQTSPTQITEAHTKQP
jgi:hypothetical protein